MFSLRISRQLVGVVMGVVVGGASTAGASLGAPDSGAGTTNGELPAVVTEQPEKSQLEKLMELPLEELMNLEVESVNKHQESIFWSSAAVSVYSRDDVLLSGARTLADFLRRVAGVDVYQVKPLSPMVGIRSLTDKSNNRILLMFDGREEIMEMVGFPLWPGLNIDLEEIERIEVIRGASSTLYGANAFLGVVSVTTVASKPLGVDAYATMGEQGGLRLFGRGRGNTALHGGNLSFSLGVGHESYETPSDPDYVQHDPLRVHGYARYTREDWLDVSLHGGYTLGEFSLYTQLGEMDLQDGLAHYVMGKGRVALSEKLKLSLQVYHNRFYGALKERPMVMAFGMWVADLPSFEFDMQILDSQAQVDFELLDSLFMVAGASFRYSYATTVNLIPSFIEESRGAGFLQLQWQVTDTLQLQGGTRVDINSVTDPTVSPRAVAVYRPWPNQSFRLGYGLSFRKPYFLEHAMHFKIQNVDPLLVTLLAPRDPAAILERSLGNPDIKNETIQSLEAGWLAHLFGSLLQLSVNGFYNRYLDVIYLDLDVGIDSIYDVGNISDTIFNLKNRKTALAAVGGELEANLRPFNDTLFWANLGLRRVFDEETGQLWKSEPILRVNAGGRYGGERGVIADLAIHYVSSYESEQFNPPDLPSPRFSTLGDSWLAVARLGYRFGMSVPGRFVELGLTAQTPLGESFREVTGFHEDPANLNPLVETTADFGGDKLHRLLFGYFRLCY